MMQVHDYTFLFVMGLVFAFLDAYGIGANDVANAFATSVGSGSITLLQALIIACFCEFGGAFLLGANTTDTIKGKIVDTALYSAQPELLMLTMVCALMGSSTWVLFASSRGWPVSTTHAIIGAITGAGIAAFGADSILWTEIGKIALSWIISPVASGVVCSIIFLITKYAILNHENSFRRGLNAIPIYFGLAITINIFYIIYKGVNNSDIKNQILVPVGIAFGAGAGVALWCFFFLRPFLRRRIEDNENLRWFHLFICPFVSKREKAPEMVAESGDIGAKGSKEANVDAADVEANSDLVKMEKEDNRNVVTRTWSKFVNRLLFGIRYDIHGEQNAQIESVHANAIKFDNDTEKLYSSLQVVTACFTSFAHGSNDVSNAIGPLATIFYVWENANVEIKKAPVPVWILVFGGVAIDLGLLTYGYKVMRTLGNKITYLSPTRGFSAELGTSVTILTCSKLGLPVSSTHCITGATTAIGLLSGGGFKSLNWRLLIGIFGGWVLTLPAAGITAGLVFAFAGRSPTIA
ncbi:Na+/Pi symporter [Actinomortierella ambigua]|uniref:Phosphate transporter n=1 Tax=Actinomortierella ambigua TaxID=1343610 RepID=A0A9P6QCX6_9FUNG|nr:Na+/Pi symporter [Actinomortierella ambigua]